MAAFLLCMAGNAGTPKILNDRKLLKLLYLAERFSLKQYGETICGDRLLATRNGMQLATLYNHLRGKDPMPFIEGGWNDLINDRKGIGLVGLRDETLEINDLRQLSASDIEVLDNTWTRFSSADPEILEHYTRYKCSEWKEPREEQGIEIPHARLLVALGYSSNATRHIVERLSAISFERGSCVPA